MSRLVLNNRLVGLQQRLLQEGFRVYFRVPVLLQICLDRLRGNTAGLLASGVSTHAICHDEEAPGRVDVIGILVD